MKKTITAAAIAVASLLPFLAPASAEPTAGVSTGSVSITYPPQLFVHFPPDPIFNYPPDPIFNFPPTPIFNYPPTPIFTITSPST